MRALEDVVVGCGLMLLLAAIPVILVATVVLAVWSGGPWGCDARWPDHENRWVLGAGCQVLTRDGWIGEDVYRVDAPR